MTPSRPDPAIVRPGAHARHLWAVVAVAALVAGCFGAATPSPSIPVVPAPTSHAPSGSTASPSSARAPVATVATPTPTAGATFNRRLALAVEPLARIDGGPLAVTNAADGSHRLFVATQSGQVRIVRDGALVARPFLDIADRITSGGERGLLGLAFHPGYPSDGRLFVDYTDRQGNTVVSSFRPSSSDPDLADPGSERIVLRQTQPFANHNGGGIAFGPDGRLYITLGDGGSSGDPQNNGQRLDTLLGKILRVDVDNVPGGGPYAVPADNPFVGREGARPEIWLTGLRNPFRFSFDQATRDLWIGDVGQGAFEEIDVARAGAGGGSNYGWARMEGSHCYPAGSDCDPGAYTLPVAEYSHDEGCAVTGGVVYRGRTIPALVGGYLFSDYCSGTLWVLDASATAARPQEPAKAGTTGGQIAGFGEDEAGEVYLADLRGAVLRLVAGH
jgi:glucose/arabinose dehydrogenase